MTFTMSDGTALKILKTSRRKRFNHWSLQIYLKLSVEGHTGGGKEREREKKGPILESRRHKRNTLIDSVAAVGLVLWQKNAVIHTEKIASRKKSEGERVCEERDTRSRKVSSFFFRSNLIFLRGGKFITLQSPEWSKSAVWLF